MEKLIEKYFENEYKKAMKEKFKDVLIKEPYKFETEHKQLIDQCEEKLLKNLERNEKNLVLFNIYKGALIQHFLEVRDLDCINVYISALGKKLANKLFKEKYKQ